MDDHREATHPQPAATAATVLAWRPYLRACLLLALAEEPNYGYGVSDAFSGLGVPDGDLSRVYRTLRDLEDRGLVVSSWSGSPDGPSRRLYYLTGSGEGALEDHARLVDLGRQSLTRYLDRYLRAGSHEALVAL